MSARTELIALLECCVPLNVARDMVDRHHAEVVAASELAAAVDAMGALPMPTAGDLAEQRHLVDPLDHVLEHLADDRPTVVLPAQRDRGSAL